MIDCFHGKVIYPLLRTRVCVQQDFGHTTILPTCLWSMHVYRAFQRARLETKTALETRSKVSWATRTIVLVVAETIDDRSHEFIRNHPNLILGNTSKKG